MKDHYILMRSQLVAKTRDGIKLVTRRLDPRWLKAKKGDTLLVKEAWATLPEHDHLKPTLLPLDAPVFYAADRLPTEDDFDVKRRFGIERWRPSLFLPKRLVRLRLRMTADAFREPLHAITEAGALLEGADKAYDGGSGLERPWTHRKGFEELWVLINGQDSWNSNPDVIVLPYQIASFGFPVKRRGNES